MDRQIIHNISGAISWGDYFGAIVQTSNTTRRTLLRERTETPYFLLLLLFSFSSFNLDWRRSTYSMSLNRYRKTRSPDQESWSRSISQLATYLNLVTKQPLRCQANRAQVRTSSYEHQENCNSITCAQRTQARTNVLRIGEYSLEHRSTQMCREEYWK